MTVWLAWAVVPYEGGCLLGIYATRADAETRCAAAKQQAASKHCNVDEYDFRAVEIQIGRGLNSYFITSRLGEEAWGDPVRDL
jgi:hypothetical protein